MLVFMAGPKINSGQQIPSFQFFIMPYLLKFLCQATFLTHPRLQKMTYHIFVRGSSWHWLLRGRQSHSIPKRLCGKKKPSIHFWTKVESNGKSKLWIYLFPVTVSIVKVGCRVEGQLRESLTSCRLRELPSITRPTYTALSSKVDHILVV